MDDFSPAVQPDLREQVALVTGGSRGLGRAFAQALAAAGAAVAVVARSADQLANTVARITTAGGRALAVPADVSKPQAVEQMAAVIAQQLGPVDLLINNAGALGPVGPVWEAAPETWWQCLESNLYGPFLCSRVLLPSTIAHRRGRIINVASTAALRCLPYGSAYTASKAALINFTEIMAAETHAYGLSIFAIHPGWVRTDMTEYMGYSPEGQQWMPWVSEGFTAGRDIPPTSAVNLILYLASGRGDGLTGRFLNVMDDVPQLVEQRAEIVQGDLYTLRLRVP